MDLVPKSNEWAWYISVPSLAGTVSYLLTLHHEGGLPEKGFRSSSTLCVSLSAPDQDHWSIHADKKFVKIVKWLAEEYQQRQKEAEDKEEVEVKEEEVGEQGEEEAAAAATTAAELPNSTTSAMESNGGEEDPSSGALLPVQSPPRDLWNV